MKLVYLTEPQASFVEIELLGRNIDDDDPHAREVMEVVLDHFERSRGRSLAVPDAELMAAMVLDAMNGIDDEIEAHKHGDKYALGRIGGVDTVSQARALQRTGESIWKKLSALSAK